MALEDADVRLRAHRRDQRAHDLAAGGVGGVQDAAMAVAALAAEIVLAVLGAGAAREVGAERDQLADALGAVAHHQVDDVAVAEAGAGDQRVLDVRLEGILRAPHRGDAALRVGGGALRQAVLGQDDDRARLGGLEREGQAGEAAADDQEIRLH